MEACAQSVHERLSLNCTISLSAVISYRSSDPLNGATQETVNIFETASAAERGIISFLEFDNQNLLQKYLNIKFFVGK